MGLVFACTLYRETEISSWRQEVGGSAIEASRIAGHRNLEMTSHYTFVAPERQNELTRRIQQKLAAAAKQQQPGPASDVSASPSTPEAPSSLAGTAPLTTRYSRSSLRHWIIWN